MATQSTHAPDRTEFAARTLFCGLAPWVTDELYCKVVRGAALRRRHRIELQAGAIAETNTYFGRFEASYWQRWTAVDAVHVTVSVSGAGRGMVRLRATDIAGHERTVETAQVGDDGDAGGEAREIELAAPLTSFLDGGALFLELRADDAPLVFADMHWSVHEARRESSHPAPARVPLAIAICTFNRADDCANTVAALTSDREVLAAIDAVYVTDQGTDPVESRPVFREAAAVLGDRLHYLRQPNLGGAGGFSRGMYEATGRDGFAGDGHVLLMDDDVRVEPETILRMAAFAAHTREPMIVGAQMLYLFNPDYLLASAEGVDLARLRAGLDADDCGLRDESVIDGVQERRIDAPYNAWWSCLIPASAIREIGLPMPYFFQWDDIEYGIRAGRRGVGTVTLPGAAVWHADFYWKDGDDFGQFFGQRNSLVTASLHGGFDVRSLAVELGRRVTASIVSMRYGQARTILMAIENFLEGPDVLGDGGQEALARVRAERGRYPDTVRRGVADVPSAAPTRRAVGIVDEDKADLVLAKRSVQQLSGRVEPGPVAIPYEDAFWWHISLFAEAYVTDGSQTGVRHLQRDARLARALGAELAALLTRFRAEAPRAAERFRRAQPDLVSRENWRRLYGI